MLMLFDFGVICYEIKNGRHILMWLATWGGSLPGQLRKWPAVTFGASCLATSCDSPTSSGILTTCLGRWF